MSSHWGRVCLGERVRLVGRISSMFCPPNIPHDHSWLPLPGLHHCLVYTQSKLIIVDPERADILEPIVTGLSREAGTTGILVLENHEGKGKWKGMRSWNHVLDNFTEIPRKERGDPRIVPEDNATIIFTSGT
jgi:long-subunit acyl-CoA synthetase (AMP-forming)